MFKSMTGFSKAEITEAGISVTVEVKSLNGRYLEVSTRMPRNLQHNELQIREAVRSVLNRGSVNVNVNIEFVDSSKQFVMNHDLAESCFNDLTELRKRLKIKETVKMEHVLHFSNLFYQKDNSEDEEMQYKLVEKALKEALKNLDEMRKKEGKEIAKDLNNRVKSIQSTVDKIESLALERVPQERDRLRQRIAQLFESDEIDEQRLQMEIVVLADKLDVSEETVRLNSHIKFFLDAMKAKESAGRKINFLLQEMHREINTIGSKINDANISQLVVGVKEELERIREQVQNIE